MTFSGCISIVDNVSSGNTCAEFWVSVYKYLLSAQAIAQGVSLVANQKGSGYSGSGFDYPGTANALGRNTWAVFRFGSATVPFYLLMQYADASFGASPGNPGVSSSTGFAIQVALRGDGTSPWNGTTNANGSDTKGDPVWIDSISAPVGLCVFPRCNSVGGSYTTHREFCSLIKPNNNNTLRANFVIDSNNFVFTVAKDISSNTWCTTYFGKYNPFTTSYDTSHAVAGTAPYVFISNNVATSLTSVPISYGTNHALATNYCIYGLTTSGVSSWELSVNDGDGGVVHPASPLSGTISVSIDAMNIFQTTAMNPNTVNSQYDVFPFAVFANENNVAGKNTCGFLGETGNFLSYVNNVKSGDTTTDLKYVFVGPPTQTTGKLMLPWDGATTPYFTGSSGTRAGVIF